MNIRIYFLIIVMTVLMPVGVHAQDKQIVGWIEKARIAQGAITLDAKLDTGADSSSVNALDINKFERDGRTWVRFTIADKKGQVVTLERELIDVTKVKRHGCPSQERYVVNLDICIGNHYSETEVGLVDRRILKYPLLIGRSFMAGRLVPDPSLEYTTEPGCQEK